MSEVPPADWDADPFGRFEPRYWDVSGWTELVGSAELADLAARGNSMAEDLAGTVAPAALAAQHSRLANAVDAISVMSATACGAPITLTAAIDHDLSEARAALVWIRHYTIRTPAPIRLDPPIPATGN